MRLDLYLTEQGLASSRTKAKELIEGGFVSVGGKTVTKSSFLLDEENLPQITVARDENQKYVGRGGLKLEGALDVFGIDPAGMCAVDIGASTGGFTDCLLQKGAVKIFAVDSGHGQLHDSLRSDPRVVSMEGVNARYMTYDMFGEQVDLAVTDVSFISQTLILPAAAPLIRSGGWYVGLIKPQFEAGKAHIGKGGIVKSPDARLSSVLRVLEAAEACGLSPIKLADSPILGGDGNREYLFAAKKDAPTHEKIAFTTKTIKECLTL